MINYSIYLRTNPMDKEEAPKAYGVAHISYALKTPPALHHIGRIMKEAGYTAVRRAGRRGHLVIRLGSEHIEAARRMLGRER